VTATLPRPRLAPSVPAFPLLFGGTVIACVALPWIVGAYQISLAASALVLGTLAMSTQLLVGVTGLPAFGQAAYFGVGAYSAALLANAGITAGPVHLVAAAGAGAVAALATAPIVLRTRATTFMMVTFAVQSLTATLASKWKPVTNGDDGLHTPAVTPWPGGPSLTVNGFVYLYVLAAVLVLGLLMAVLLRSRLGLVLRGNADHEQRMAALGHRVTGELTLGYVAAGAFAGAGGALLIAVNRYVSPADLGFEIAAVTLLAAAIGAGSMTGAVVGAGLVVFARDYLGGSTDGHGPALLGVLFLLVAYGRPVLRRFRS
jgi:branched-chain amino acid transport system permease protein